MKKDKILALITTVIQNELAPIKAMLNKQVEDNNTLSREQVMKMLNISSTTFWKRVGDRTLPNRKIGRKYVFLESEIIQILKEDNQ